MITTRMLFNDLMIDDYVYLIRTGCHNPEIFKIIERNNVEEIVVANDFENIRININNINIRIYEDSYLIIEKI